MLYLYVITNLVNGKQYVGVSTEPTRRWREHSSGHGSKLVHNAIKKYGLGNFEFKSLWCGSPNLILEFEKRAIAKRCSQVPNGYNLSGGGSAPMLGCKHSVETRQRMSESRSGNGNAMHGRKHSQQTREKIAERTRARPPGFTSGEKNGMFGRVGSTNPNAKRVLVNGVEYNSMTDAAEANGCCPKLLRARMQRFRKNNSFPNGWGYL